MQTDPRILISRVFSSPQGADSLEPEEAALAAKLLADMRPYLEERARTQAPKPAAQGAPETLLTVAEVAQRFNVTKRWVYQKARGWSFAIRLSRKVLRIPERQLEAWMRRNRP